MLQHGNLLIQEMVDHRESR